MHELSVAKSLIEMVSEHAVSEGASAVRQINIRIGSHAVVTRSLYLCFSTAVRGTMCENAELCIEEVPLTVFCNACQEVKAPASRYNFKCPDCGAPTPDVVTGREMQLISLNLVYDDLDNTTPAMPYPQETSTRRSI